MTATEPEAAPASVPASDSALLLVDLMPRILALSLAPYAGELVLRRCRALAADFRSQGLPVVQIRVDRPGVDEQPPGSGFAEELVEPSDVVVVKQTLGAFQDTGLHEELVKRGVRRVVVAGLVTTMGVESTARAALDLGYEVEFVADAMSAFAADEQDFTVERIFPRLGTVRNAAAYRPLPFVPADFVIPRTLDAGEFRLEPLGPEHNEQDRAAWGDSVEHIRNTPGFDGSWPPAEGISLTDNLRDLHRHARDFEDRRGFTFTVLDALTSTVIGCVYVYPDREDPRTADVSSWVTAERAALDGRVVEVVGDWLDRSWPFGALSYR
ncbi:isochorismatase family protein [Streptomyces sp. NPDC051561]|uniref:isochorismatase family protein n=1 Tax=Streptomyces sp. NPDC051561 TaxID=3365658 RepID=UPI0037A35FDD